MKARPEKRIAVALEYDGENAPTVTATGADNIADKIIAIAVEHGVPLQRNDGLVIYFPSWNWAMRSPRVCIGRWLR